MADKPNEVNEGKLNRFAAAVVMFVVVLILAFLAVQLVRFLPVAFSSLASIFAENQRDLNDRYASNDEDENVIEDDQDSDSSIEDEEENDVPVKEEEKVEEKPRADSEVKPTPTPAPIQYKTVVTYQVPVSDPNGYSDLEIAFVAVGQMSSNGKFIAAEYLKEDETNAVQFRVKNIGTKTSSDWRFEAELPNGDDLNSKNQLALKPGEVSTLTLVFGMGDDKAENLVVSVEGGSDNNRANNSFTVKNLKVK